MTDPNQNCPNGFRLVSRTEPPRRMCGRPGPIGCVSTIFSTHRIEYSRVCGRVIGYQDNTPDAFEAYATGAATSIDIAITLVVQASLTVNHHGNIYGHLHVQSMKLNPIIKITHAHV